MSIDPEKSHAPIPLFDPQAGSVILSPEAEGPGYWVGAPAVVRDDQRDSLLLCYRRRRPRGHESDRGYNALIAESTDGETFATIWGVTKEELETTSIEKCCVLRGHDGVYRYYLSYVDPADERWRTDVVEAASPERFDIRTRRPVFTAASASESHDAPVEGVKDPNVYRIGGLYYMLLSFAEGRPADESDAKHLHATSDVYSTGLLTAATAIATSTDGVHFEWRGKCLDAGTKGSWDQYQVRIGSILRRDSLWIGYYDGSASADENYEERVGIAQSFDLRSWERVTASKPALTVPHATGSVRYVDVLTIGRDLHFYFEVVKPDGSHELRRSIVSTSIVSTR